MSPPATRPLEQGIEIDPYRPSEPVTATATVTAKNGSSTSAAIDQRQYRDNRRYWNNWGPWVSLACLLGGLGFGGVIVGAILMPDSMQSRAKAEAAVAQERAQNALVETRLLREDMRQLQTQLAQKGIEIQLNSH